MTSGNTDVSGFSFSGEVREPFPAVIEALKTTSLTVTSVDAPSSWGIEGGAAAVGTRPGLSPDGAGELDGAKAAGQVVQGATLRRRAVSTSNTLPNCAEKAPSFVSPQIARKYDLELAPYEGLDQVVEVGPNAQKL